MYLGAIYRKSGAIKKGTCTYKFPSKQKEHKAPNFYIKHTDTKVCLLDLKSLVLFIDRMVTNCLILFCGKYSVCHYIADETGKQAVSVSFLATFF